MIRTRIALLLAGCCFSELGLAAEPTPELPSLESVARVLKSAPVVRAADSQIQAEEANRTRLEAGSHEWSVRLENQRRRVNPAIGADERYYEWTATLERPIRLPGKAGLDGQLGAQGVAIAETARGDTLHETSRYLLRSWFAWLQSRENAAQWARQADLLGQQARAVARRQQLGDAARLESVQAEAALAQAEAQLAQARVKERTATEELKRRFPGLSLPEQVALGEPQPVAGGEQEWLDAILEHSHELEFSRLEAQRAQTQATRSSREMLPDPTLGLKMARERGGEENLVGVVLSIPLPGQARRAGAEVARAQAEVATNREAAALQKVSADAVMLYHQASAARENWLSSRAAAERLNQAAEMTARAYKLGEGSLNDLLTARRLANEAALAARLAQLDALESRYRLLLDAHRLWPLDDHGDH